MNHRSLCRLLAVSCLVVLLTGAAFADRKAPLRLAGASDPRSLDMMVIVPAGEFQMGSTTGDEDEKPVHKVYLDAFYMDKYEVVQADFERLMGSNPSEFKDPARPVDHVTWMEAREYCEKVGKRLPTEAEWEYAARGGPHGGKGVLGGYWFDGNSMRQIQPVGQKAPNSLGLYDMLGNAWEWVEDWYDAGFYKTSPYKNPKNPTPDKFRVMRGGSWIELIHLIRPTYRGGYVPTARGTGNGFRCVVTISTNA
ncbi:MAG: formylglycine-generating enzyme family protein [Nitrospinales bacterium]